MEVISKILYANSVQELQSVGSYLEVKSNLESKLGIKLGARSWQELFDKIEHLKKVVAKNKEILLAKRKSGSFKDSKKEIAEILDLKLRAQSRQDLKKKVQKIVHVFCPTVLDPYAYYEKTKLLNFKHSSMLEGINMEISADNVSLKAVLAKYER